MIIDAHCHVIVPAMAGDPVPAGWRASVTSEPCQDPGAPGCPAGQHAHQVVAFRGRRIQSMVGEFTDIGTMLGEATAAGVDHLLLSPWINLVPVDATAPDAQIVCDVQNEALAAITAAWPGRVSAVGAVPLQDPALAGKQLADLMRVPGLCGVEIPSSVGGRYLGDEFFLPFWEAAEASGALVFIHPSTHGFGVPALDEYYLWNSVGNPLETAVTAAHIAMAGVLERYPRLRVLLAHGGGALPIVRGRLRRAFAVRPEPRARLAAEPDESLRRFYYDTVTHDRDLLADLVRYAGADHVLLGSDRPFDMGTEHPVEEVRALKLAEGEDLILGRNAARLLGVADG